MLNFTSFPCGTVDLHLHTSASDGSDTPTQLLCTLRKKGIRIFSVTDHDTVDSAKAVSGLVPDDMYYVPGIEFSCRTEHGNCHILGYGMDMTHPDFLSALEQGRTRRMANLRRRIAYLDRMFGISLTQEELSWLHAQQSPGKPHLGRILLNRGIAPDLDAAIQTFIAPCKCENDRIGADTAVSAIRNSGGIAVWAHPLGGEGERRLTPDTFSAQLKTLLTCGIAGLECYYSRYDENDRAVLLEKASGHGLFVSGGSDYHGKNKTGIYPGKLGVSDTQASPCELSILPYLFQNLQ